MSMTSEPALEALKRLVGTWTTEAIHPSTPGIVVPGNASFEWLAGERFLIHRSHHDHPAFPDAVSIIGFTERDRVDAAPPSQSAAADKPRMTMHYFDSRGVFRVYDVSIDDVSWRIQRNAPGFSQRFTGTFAEDGDTLIGLWQLSQDDTHWDDDLRVTYRRRR
ncbi:DUF1579 domain-containing protein [Hyalangium gracile]|uniref:DUF1579 domain-containing protein n=1 Tax=Hyalangium gracile TaxID=394092 RepID=UPI001CCB02EF|nr:DUF1579 domain-containing protein [Hyalangium gracile]